MKLLVMSGVQFFGPLLLVVLVQVPVLLEERYLHTIGEVPPPVFASMIRERGMSSMFGGCGQEVFMLL